MASTPPIWQVEAKQRLLGEILHQIGEIVDCLPNEQVNNNNTLGFSSNIDFVASLHLELKVNIAKNYKMDYGFDVATNIELVPNDPHVWSATLNHPAVECDLPVTESQQQVALSHKENKEYEVIDISSDEEPEKSLPLHSKCDNNSLSKQLAAMTPITSDEANEPSDKADQSNSSDEKHKQLICFSPKLSKNLKESRKRSTSGSRRKSPKRHTLPEKLRKTSKSSRSRSRKVPQEPFRVISLNCTIKSCTSEFSNADQLNEHLLKVHHIKEHRCQFTKCTANFDDRYVFWLKL